MRVSKKKEERSEKQVGKGGFCCLGRSVAGAGEKRGEREVRLSLCVFTELVRTTAAAQTGLHVWTEDGEQTQTRTGANGCGHAR